MFKERRTRAIVLFLVSFFIIHPSRMLMSIDLIESPFANVEGHRPYRVIRNADGTC